MKINLAYNLSFKHLKGSEINKKQSIVHPLPHYSQIWTVKLLFKNSRIHKHMTNFKTHALPRFYVDIINVCSLCYGKWMRQVKDVKDGTCFMKFLKSIYSSYTIHINETADIFGDHFLPPDFSGRVFWTSCSSFFILFLLFLIPSISGVLCCLSIFCGYITTTECL